MREAPDELEVLAAGQVAVDGRVLAGEADVVADGIGVARDVDAEHLGVTAGRVRARREDADGRGLAGTVRAEQTEDRSRRDLEVDAAEGLDVAEALLEPDGADGCLRGVGFHAGHPGMILE